jgi:hypothetical protein
MYSWWVLKQPHLFKIMENFTIFVAKGGKEVYDEWEWIIYGNKKQYLTQGNAFS